MRPSPVVGPGPVPVLGSDMSESDGVSVSRLIALVRERPVLWDRQEEVYKNRKLTKKAWAEICETLFDNYGEIPEEDQKAFARSVIGKWANLRDNWLRYWRKRQDYLRAGTCNSRFKKYVHHEQLMFLSKVYDQSDIQQEVEEIQVEVDVLSDPGSESPQGFSSEEVSQPPWNLGVSSEEVSQTPWNLPLAGEVPEEKSPIPLLPVTEERHLYFFQSTLPLIADFDENQVLDFHAAVLECIKRIKSGKNAVNMVQTPQPAYILAIAQPQSFLTSTEVKPKVLTETNTSKQCPNTSEENIPKKDSVINCTLSVSSSSAQTDNGTKQNVGQKSQQSENNSTQISPSKRQALGNSELTDLKSVVNKLDEISKKFESSPFQDSHDKFGKYIGSFLRTLPLKKARLLKRRIVRQVFRVQMSDKINTSQLNKPVENKKEPLNFNSCLKLQQLETYVENKSQSAETAITNSPVGKSILAKNKIHSETQVEESTNNSVNIIKSNGNPVDECPKPLSDVEPHRFACHVCGYMCISSTDLRTHCSNQHKGYSPSFKSKAEPVKRGRRGRKKKIYYDNTEFLT